MCNNTAKKIIFLKTTFPRLMIMFSDNAKNLITHWIFKNTWTNVYNVVRNLDVIEFAYMCFQYKIKFLKDFFEIFHIDQLSHAWTFVLSSRFYSAFHIWGVGIKVNGIGTTVRFSIGIWIIEQCPALCHICDPALSDIDDYMLELPDYSDYLYIALC